MVLVEARKTSDQRSHSCFGSSAREIVPLGQGKRMKLALIVKQGLPVGGVAEARRKKERLFQGREKQGHSHGAMGINDRQGWGRGNPGLRAKE